MHRSCWGGKVKIYRNKKNVNKIGNSKNNMWQSIRHDFWGLRGKLSKIQVDKISSKYYKSDLLCMDIRFFFKHFPLIMISLLSLYKIFGKFSSMWEKKHPSSLHHLKPLIPFSIFTSRLFSIYVHTIEIIFFVYILIIFYIWSCVFKGFP